MTEGIAKWRVVDALLRAQGLDPADVAPETLQYWLASDRTAVEVAAILLGHEDAKLNHHGTVDDEEE